MATDTSRTLKLWYLVEGYPKPSQIIFPVNDSIHFLTKFMQENAERDGKLRGIDFLNLTFWKLQVNEPVIPAATLAARVYARGDFSRFALELDEPGVSVLDVFPVDRPSENLHIIVQVRSDVRLQHIYSEDDQFAKLERQRATSVQQGKNALAPSSAARLPMLKTEQEKRPVMNGRPMGNSGLPVHIFHPAFSLFQLTLTDPGLVLTADDYRRAHEYILVSSDLYDTVRLRREEVFTSLNSAIHFDFIAVINKDGTSSDGSILAPTADKRYVTIGVCELKNEIGMSSSDPSIQGAFSYRKIWVADKLSSIRNSCGCPSFVLAIAGPWMCVLGAVFTETVLVQQLTDFVWTGGNPFHDRGLESVTRLFRALRVGLEALESFYSTLSISSPSTAQPIFPSIRSYSDPDGKQVNFTYVERFHKSKAVYLAKDDTGRRLVVKFVERYNSRAHRLLADRGLAPNLYYSALDYVDRGRRGGLEVVVMSFAEGRNAYEHFSSARLPNSVFPLVKQAMDILHTESIVFGDLRLPNIIITGDEKPMLIDFDWCGTHMVD